MPNQTPATRRQPRAATDLRRAISPQTWLANRARNALRRPAFIGAISAGTFVTALVSMIVVPRAQRRDAEPIRTAPRPDTLALASSAATAKVRLAEADSSLALARSRSTAAAADSFARTSMAQQDSLHARLTRFERLLTLAAQAPLFSSYKALAETPELRGDVRVAVLLDSLSIIEREREAVGAAGGVDPVFVSLTARANEMGRAIQAIATQHRAALLAELSIAEPATSAGSGGAAPVDTALLLATRDSLRLALAQSSAELSRRREVSRGLDRDEELAHARATAVAPPLAMLGAAFVLSAAIGFGFAFLGELRRPRAADDAELERYLGVRVLATVETPVPSVDRGRRQADRAAPPYLNPGAQGYQLAYLGLSTEQPSVLMTTVTGDDPAVAAVVCCNMAAVAADEARNTLVIDLEPTCSASATLRVRARPGFSDIRSGQATWPDATVAAPVGRNKTVDLVPCGVSGRASTDQLIQAMRQDTPRLARYYDAVLVIAGAADVAAGFPTALLSPDVVFCAQAGVTPLKKLRTQLERIGSAGGVVRGVVLWNAERPSLPTPREVEETSRKRLPAEQRIAVAASGPEGR